MKLFSEQDSRLAVLEKKVGLFVFAAIGALLLAILFIAIEQGLFASTTTFRFHTDDASKLHEGMELRLSGFKVGKVTSVVLMEDGMIEARLEIQNQYLSHIRHEAKLRLVEQGLLGDSMLEVVPGNRNQIALVEDELLPFERQLGIDALAHDLVERLKPILDNVNVSANALNQPDGLLQHAKSVAVQVEKNSAEATELMRQTRTVIAGSDAKITQTLTKTNQAIDQTNTVLSKAGGVMDNVQKITSDVGKVSSNAAENVPSVMHDGRVAAEDARSIIEGSKTAWPIRNFIDTNGEHILPMDSYGVNNDPAK